MMVHVFDYSGLYTLAHRTGSCVCDDTANVIWEQMRRECGETYGRPCEKCGESVTREKCTSYIIVDALCFNKLCDEVLYACATQPNTFHQYILQQSAIVKETVCGTRLTCVKVYFILDIHV